MDERKEKVIRLIKDNTKEHQPQDKAPAPESAATARTVELLAQAPEALRRPLCLVGGHAYAAAWLWVRVIDRQTVDEKGRQTVHNPPLVRDEQVLAVVRGDGMLFSDGPIPGAQPLAELGVAVHLPEIPPASHTWSGAGVERFLAGERPAPAATFRKVADVFDCFMDFNRSLAPQETMCELSACYVLTTYGLDALSVTGYLWPNGMQGGGKTKYLNTVTGSAHLGQTILAGGSYASLRDFADYGATLAFDDAEAIMDTRKADPDKRALLMAGNRRGAIVTIKEPVGKRGWVTRYINAFCPRLFSAIRLPDPVLASRTIIIPLVRSADRQKANSDPCDWAAWPHDRRRLIDDLWAVGLMALPRLKGHDAVASARAHLSGRNLEPWRAVLAVALWLQEEHGAAGLFGRMEALSMAYQGERADLESDDPTRLAVLALREMAAVSPAAVLRFKTAELVERVNRLAVEQEVVGEGGDKFTNAKRVGKLLARLRFRQAEREGNKHVWRATQAEIEALALSYGMGAVAEATNDINGENGETAEEDGGRPAVLPFQPSVPFLSPASALEGNDMERNPAQPIPLFADVAGSALAALGEGAVKDADRANPARLWTPGADTDFWASLKPRPHEDEAEELLEGTI